LVNWAPNTVFNLLVLVVGIMVLISKGCLRNQSHLYDMRGLGQAIVTSIFIFL